MNTERRPTTQKVLKAPFFDSGIDEDYLCPDNVGLHSAFSVEHSSASLQGIVIPKDALLCLDRPPLALSAVDVCGIRLEMTTRQIPCL